MLRGAASSIRLAAAALLLTFAFAASAQTPFAGDVGEYALGVGDKVNVTVFRHEDLSGEFEVDGVGRITLPLIGQVQVGGLSAAEAEAAVVARLKPDYLKNPKVSIQVLSVRPFYIIGEVKNPGSYAYVSGMTVVQAVALAGGFTYRAKEDRILIRKAGAPEDARRIARQTDAVAPGDVIEVPERFF